MTLSSEEVRLRERRATRLRRVLIGLVVGALPTLLSCRPSRATEIPRHPGDVRSVDPSRVDPLFADAWAEVVRLRDADPTDPQIPMKVDALLALGPPVDLRLAAQLAKAQQAYLTGQDPQAVLAVDQALSGVEVPDANPPAVAVELMIVRVRAMVRGGDPSRSLVALDEPILRAPGVLDPVERLSLRAIALERNGQFADAVVALARWRAQVGPDTAAAAYAERRIDRLGRSVDPVELQEAWAELPNDHARMCLEAKFAGATVPAEAPPWVKACKTGSMEIGLLLPRSGPLSALADPQLAAASVASAALSAELHLEPVLRFRDAGSTPAAARTAARELVGQGADVVVGPVGPSNVRAVASVLPESVDVIVPGESVGRAIGVAPTLEGRVQALVVRARSLGVTRFVVAAPANGYGNRAVEAIEKALERKESKSLIIQRYDVSTTSFAPTLAPLMPALGKGAALIVPDTLKRTELLVRQLARSDHNPSADGVEGTVVLGTGEGAGPDQLGAGHEILDGVWLAPVAVAVGNPAVEQFAEAYAAEQGSYPSDQALLVYLAMRRALTGDTSAPVARTVVVQGGRLVAAAPSSG
jgi:ABC-type branched-subunit amino acid transport system substrate-binding protein